MEKKLLERKIHEEKAFKIVTRLATETVNAETLLKLVRYIEPFHYEEIVEERYLTKLCGYSLCSNELKNIPAKKYQIASKVNKVYELSDRKRYCSVECFKSSKYLQEQISTTPVWLRDTPTNAEESRREIKLIPHTKEQQQHKSSIIAKTHSEVEARSKLVDFSEIESELNDLEKNWRDKYQKLEEKKHDVPIALADKEEKKINNNIYKKLNINEKLAYCDDDTESKFQSQKKQPLNESRQIKAAEFLKQHQQHNSDKRKSFDDNFSNKLFLKPTELHDLKKIFAADDQASLSSDYLSCFKTRQNEQGYLKSYLFIEYLVKRLDDMLTDKTREYLSNFNKNSAGFVGEFDRGQTLMENSATENHKTKLQQEREREEYLEKCDRYVLNRGLIFSDLSDTARNESTINKNKNDDDDTKLQQQRPMMTNNDNRPDEKSLIDDELTEEEKDMRRKIEYLENIYQYSSSSSDNKLQLPLNLSADNTSSLSASSVDFICDSKKPLPNYEQLKEDALLQQLKVKEFFKSTTKSSSKAEEKEKVSVDNANRVAATVIDLTSDLYDFCEIGDDKYNSNMVIKIKETNEEIVRLLPTVDSKSQMIIRRKIFYEKLIKYMEQILKLSQFNHSNISIEIKNHIKNFVYSLKLTNENMIYGSNEWPIIAIFILKLLSSKKSNFKMLDDLINKDDLIEAVLNSFKLDKLMFELICNYLIFK